jgi:hypothetical protein
VFAFFFPLHHCVSAVNLPYFFTAGLRCDGTQMNANEKVPIGVHLRLNVVLSRPAPL